METGLKYMAPTTNKLNDIPFKDLSIQVSLNGLSFCVLNQKTHTIDYLHHIKTDKQLNPLDLSDLLKKQLDTEALFNESFKNVVVIHENELSSLVPKSLFNEEHMADYLKFNSKILKSDYLAHEELSVGDTINVYVPYVNINNQIYDRFGEFIYKHHSSILIEQILQTEKHSTKPKMYANISNTYFDLVIVENGSLKLYNRFEYTTKEDFIYYVLFTAEQLNLNPETFELIFTGDIDNKDELHAVAYKYIRFVFFAKRSDSFKFANDAQPDNEHDDFILIHSF